MVKNAKEKFRADKEEKELSQRRLYQGAKVEEMRIQMKIGCENNEERKLNDDSSVKGKLPKLVISKFEGIALDWFHEQV